MAIGHSADWVFQVNEIPQIGESNSQQAAGTLMNAADTVNRHTTPNLVDLFDDAIL